MAKRKVKTLWGEVEVDGDVPKVKGWFNPRMTLPEGVYFDHYGNLVRRDENGKEVAVECK